MLKQLLQRISRSVIERLGCHEFPQFVQQHWYCGSWYMWLGELRDNGEYEGGNLDPDPAVLMPFATDKVAFNHFHMGVHGRDGSMLIDGLIPAIRIGDRVGLYKASHRYRKENFFDGAMWDDGYHVDLSFVRSIPMEDVPYGHSDNDNGGG